MQQLDGKGAVITGGASGIGFATAEILAAKGAKVVLADIEEAALEAAVRNLRDAGADAYGVACDVRSLDAVESLADAAFRELGGVHIVFNNAGVAVVGPVLEATHDDWRWTIDVDLWGPIHGVEAFLPRIVEQGEGGHILFTASFAGLVPNQGLGPYCAAKYGVVAIAEVLWRELREHEIGVSVLCPMRVDTNISQSDRNRQADYAQTAASVAAASDDDSAYAGRVLTVESVAALTVEAIEHNNLYVLPHEESREFIRRRFARIDQSFDGAVVR